MKTTLNILWKAASGGNGTTNITFTNPGLSDGLIREFGEMLNNLTTNTLRGINRTDVTDVTSAYYVAPEKSETTVTSSTDMAVFVLESNLTNEQAASITWTTDAQEQGFNQNISNVAGTNTFRAGFFAISAENGTYAITAKASLDGVEIASTVLTIKVAIEG